MLKPTVEAERVCAACGKPLARNKGSLTFWIFGDTNCKCTVPSAQVLVPATAGQQPVGSAGLPADQTAEKPDLGERYEVLELLGQGGMGSVWKVRDKAIDQTLAIKILRPDLAADKFAVKRFEQEAQVAAGLTHANLVAVYGSGRAKNDCPYLIMDYLDGESLADVLKREVYLPVARVLNLAGQICEALAHAHAKGVVHRDLKPSNIILTTSNDGHDIVKIVDFGIVKVMPTIMEQTDNLTKTGDLFGSPLYMSPEQCLGQDVDARADVYSLGCVLFEAVSGKTPFAHSNPIGIILSQINDEPNFAPLRQCHAPRQVLSVISTCLQKEPGSRYQSMKALEADLSRIEHGQLPAVALATGMRKKLFKATYATVRYVAESNLYYGLLTLVIGALILFKTGHLMDGHLQTNPDGVKRVAQLVASFEDPLPSGLKYVNGANSSDRQSVSVLDESSGLTFTLQKVPKSWNPAEERLTDLFTGGVFEPLGTLTVGGQSMPYGYRRHEAEEQSDHNATGHDAVPALDFSHLIGRMPLKDKASTITLLVDASPPGKVIDMKAVVHFLNAVKKF
jgi:serine/threonine protein kinase